MASRARRGESKRRSGGSSSSSSSSSSAAAGAAMTIRVRGPTAMWRIDNLGPSTTVRELKGRVEAEHGVAVAGQRIHLDRGCKDDPVPPQKTLRELRLRHGSIVYIKFDPTQVAAVGAEASKTRIISEDGTILAAPSAVQAQKNAVRPGLMSLRSRKLHWTLDELMQIEAGYTFKISRQEKAVCTGVSLDSSMCNDYQQHIRNIGGFAQKRRCAWLYGRYVEKLAESHESERDGSKTDSFGRELKVRVRRGDADGQKVTEVQVECAYEPPQRCTADTMELLEDPEEDHVERVAKMLGLERVGFMFSHPGGRETGHNFSANEIIMCAENQLLAGDERMCSPFVSVKVTVSDDGMADFQAFQMSKQCLELVAEGALLHDPSEPRACLINDTFSCLVEMKEVSRVDNDFFLAGVPIMQHTSPLAVRCPQPHRFGGHQWNTKALPSLLREHKALNPLQRVSDFHALLLISKVVDPKTMKSICHSVAARQELEPSNANIINSLG